MCLCHIYTNKFNLLIDRSITSFLNIFCLRVLVLAFLVIIFIFANTDIQTWKGIFFLHVIVSFNVHFLFLWSDWQHFCMPSESTIFLIVYGMRLLIFIRYHVLYLLNLCLNFSIDFESAAFSWAEEASICMQIKTMTDKFLKIKQLRMFTIFSSGWYIQ